MDIRAVVTYYVGNKEFKTFEEAQTYAISRAMPQMWNIDGEEVDNIGNAWLIHIASGEEIEALNEEADGFFEDDDRGFFYWDEWEDQWRYISAELVEMMKNLDSSDIKPIE